MDGEGVILIGGSMRSGTTLLHRILCASEDTHSFTDECQYLTALLNFHADWYDRFSWLKEFFGTPENFDAHTKSIVDSFLRSSRRTLRPRRALVLKQPELSLHFPRLAEWYRNAKLVVTVRDPRDTITSMLDVAARHEKSKVVSNIAAMGRDMEKLSHYYKSFYIDALQSPKCRDRVAVVKYEDLVADPRRAVAALSDFLGLRLDLARLMPDNFDRRDRDDYVAAFWTNLRSAPPSAESVGRYRSALTPAEIAAIERHCADFNRGIRYW
jgi:hypothetical protein